MLYCKNIIWLILCFSLAFTACEKPTIGVEADDFYHVQMDKTSLPVWVRGNTASQKLVIYINGGPGLTSIDVAAADLFHWQESLEKQFAMVYYDQRGTGNAQGNIDHNTLTVEQYVQDLHAIVLLLQDQYPNTDIYLMSHSFGGFIATRYLLDQDQGHITGWILVDGALNFDFDLQWVYRRQFLIDIAHEEITKGNDVAKWQEALQWVDDNPVITEREQKDTWNSYIGQPGEGTIPEEIADINTRQALEVLFFSSYNVFPGFLSSNLDIVNDSLNNSATGHNYIDSVGRLTLPTLMLWGKYDDLIPPRQGQDIFDNLGTPNDQKTFVLMPQSSHEPFISDPDRFDAAVMDFVKMN